MKLGGKSIKRPEKKPVVFKRGDDEYVFWIKPVLSFEEHSKINPEPTTVRTYPGGRTEEVPDESKHDEWHDQRMAWLFIESLSATPDLEWDQVDLNKPETWSKFKDELADSGFSDFEINYLISQILDLSCINVNKIEEATQDFLATQQAKG